MTELKDVTEQRLTCKHQTCLKILSGMSLFCAFSCDGKKMFYNVDGS
jgi:hypothetical protein